MNDLLTTHLIGFDNLFDWIIQGTTALDQFGHWLLSLNITDNLT
jgi:hypothetical protein